MPIIALSGKAGSGKDTLAERIVKQDPRFVVKKFAEPLKAIVAMLTGLPIEDMNTATGKAKTVAGWNMTVGEIQQKVGTEGIRSLYANAWVDATLSAYDPAKDFWVITDCRFPNEGDGVHERGGVVVRIERGGYDYAQSLGGRDAAHASETAMDNYQDFDCMVENTTLENLDTVAKMLITLSLREPLCCGGWNEYGVCQCKSTHPEPDWIAREYGVGPFDRYAEPPAVRCPKASEPYPYDSTR